MVLDLYVTIALYSIIAAISKALTSAGDSERDKATIRDWKSWIADKTWSGNTVQAAQSAQRCTNCLFCVAISLLYACPLAVRTIVQWVCIRIGSSGISDDGGSEGKDVIGRECNIEFHWDTEQNNDNPRCKDEKNLVCCLLWLHKVLSMWVMLK